MINDLVYKDLSQRLPYDVVIECSDGENIKYKCFLTEDILKDIHSKTNDYTYKPYLRSLEDMTEDEDKEFALLQIETSNFGFLYVANVVNVINWLNVHHFDYNNLIEKGLAIKVTKENNPY